MTTPKGKATPTSTNRENGAEMVKEKTVTKKSKQNILDFYAHPASMTSVDEHASLFET